MYNANCFLMTDFYKTTHLMQYDERITELTSYLTPRKSRFSSEGIDHIVVFGMANFVQQYLVDAFNENFFNLEWNFIQKQINDTLVQGLGYSWDQVDNTSKKVKELWNYQSLPLIIRGLPEGMLCPMGVPMFEIKTTVPELFWVGQAIESLLSCSVWHPMVSATIAREYAKIAKFAYDRTSEGDWRRGMCDFSMRGQESYESAVNSSMGWLTSFYNSSTVDARFKIRDVYNISSNDYICGLTSTEHSVMCSDKILNDGDERETYRRLLTEVYPHTSFAAVCDSFDFWRIVTEVLPSLREEIENHKGFLGVRHDSATNPVDALCGLPHWKFNYEEWKFENFEDIDETIEEVIKNQAYNINLETNMSVYCEFLNEEGAVAHKGVYLINPEWINERGSYTDNKYSTVNYYFVKKLYTEPTYEDKGMVETLYELFGGNTNSKGYKVMNPHLKAVYGDSITIPRAREIYRRLEEKGFAADNVSLGVGSFSMECIELKDGTLAPFTRDTFSIAIKSTHGKYYDETEEKEKEFFIYKQPKGMNDKAFQKGLCRVYRDENGVIKYVDELYENDNCEYEDIYRDYFVNDTVLYEDFSNIRQRVWGSLEGEQYGI